MNIAGTHYRTIWPLEGGAVRVIDQSRLPFEFCTVDLQSLEDAARAIKTMVVRGAPLIGAAAAYGVALAMRSEASDASLEEAVRTLRATRPTAVNLAWALTRMREVLERIPSRQRDAAAMHEAGLICEEDVNQCRRIGQHGLVILRELEERSRHRVNILT